MASNEAAVTVVMRMRDEASEKMENFGKTTEQATLESIQMNTALTAMGSALTAVGSLVNQIDNEFAKTAGTIITTAGAILTTTSAIITMLPYIRQMIATLRTLAATQAIVNALSGPAGLLALAIGGAAIGGLAVASANSAGSGGGQTNVTNINVEGSVTTERRIAEMTRTEFIKNQNRNNTTGVR